MSRIFEGSARVYVNTHGQVTIARDDNGKLNADNVGEAVKAIVKAGKQLDRWAFYIPEVSQSLARDEKSLPLSKFAKAVKDDNNVVVLEAGKWGKPRISVRPKVVTTKVSGKTETIF